MSKIDCVTVSIGFDDYLSLTLPNMMHCFDRVAVVTEAADEATCRVAEEAGALVVRSERKQFAGEPFNLPALINDGFLALGPTEWIAKIDSDIYVPWGARRKLEACLDDPATAEAVKIDVNIGTKARVRGTPTMLIGGYKLSGVIRRPFFEGMLSKLQGAAPGE